MTTLAAIKAAQLQARKDKNALSKDLLTTLIGEIDNELRKPGAKGEDELVQTTVKAFLKRIDEYLGVATDEAVVEKLKAEKAVLVAFQPTQMSAAELQTALEIKYVQGLPNAGKGAMMGYLKTTFPGQYDGKVAAQVVDAMLKAQ